MTRKTLSFERNPLFSGPSLEARTRSGSPFRQILVADIDVDPDQPRKSFDPEALSALAASIKEFGVLCPILVRLNAGGTYKLVSGERRLRACQILGLDSVPAIVDSGENEGSDILSKQLVENLQREDLTAMEKAFAIGQLRETFSLSVRDISKRLGLSKSAVQRSLDILNLPEDLQAAIASGLSESKVLLLKQVNDRRERAKLLVRLEDMTRAQLEEAILGLSEDGAGEERLSHGGTAKESTKWELSSEDNGILNELQRSLGTKVQMVRSKQKVEQGKLIIDFYSNSDLKEIYRRLCP